MSAITEFTDLILYPRLFEVMDTVFPEFKFRKCGGNWASSNKLRLTGHEGNHVGSVCIYRDRPYFIQDYSSGGKAITSYLQDTGQASSWIEAVKFLARRVGLEIPSRDISEEDLERSKEATNRANIYEVANSFLIDSLSGLESEIAKTSAAKMHFEYIENRGYGKLLRSSRDDINSRANCMEIGFIASQENLRLYLKSKDFTLDEINRYLNLNPGIGDTHKLSIPFRDPLGRIIGFAFRSITWTKDSTVGKYLYSTGLQRNALLFNLRAIKGDKDLIVVEGLLDALHAKALGLENVVALGGTSLNEVQVKSARGYGAEKITLCLDQDDAGEKATDRALQVINKIDDNLKVYVATLPAGFKDPDELIRKLGIEAFHEAIKKAQSHYIYRLNKLFDNVDQIKLKAGELDNKDRDFLLEEAVTIGSQTKGPFERDLFLNAFDKRGEFLGVTRKSFDATIERLQFSLEKKKQDEELRKTLEKAQSLLSSGCGQEAKDLLSKHSKQINQGLLETSYYGLVKPMTEAEIRERLQHKPDHIDSGLKFGENNLLIPSGAITILAAPTSHGKTSFQINLALNVANDPKSKPIYLFSYEESREAIFVKALNTYINKYLSANNRRSIESYFKTGTLEFISKKSQEEFEALKKSFFTDLVESGRLNIHYVDYPVEDLIGAIKFLHKHENVGAVFIDYMQLLRLKNNRTSSRQEELKQVCLALKDCSVDTGLPIILGAQFNRTVTTIKSIHATAIGEAGDIERIANLIIGFWNKQFKELDQDYFTPSHEIYATILKGRDIGAGASENFSFNGNTGKISNNGNICINTDW